MISKPALRAIARERLGGLTPEVRLRAGGRIAAAVWSLAPLRAARTVLLFASLPSEVPTDEIADEARRRGIQLVYPRCLPDDGMMVLHRVDRELDLIAGGRFGIHEPAADCPIVDVAEIDAAFIPGLCWDRSGFRLGWGAGYYDRLLAAPGWRGYRCGLFFAVQEVPTVPRDAWDRPIDAVVTEKEVVTFSPSRPSA